MNEKIYLCDPPGLELVLMVEVLQALHVLPGEVVSLPAVILQPIAVVLQGGLESNGRNEALALRLDRSLHHQQPWQQVYEHSSDYQSITILLLIRCKLTDRTQGDMRCVWGERK